MKNTNRSQQNVFGMWIRWHFFEMPEFLFLIWKNYLYFGANFFSIPYLIMTFFSPWRHYKWRYPRGFNIGEYYKTFISNLFSRILGAFCRIGLIIFGVLFQIFIFIIGIIVIFFWILIPLILILGILYLLF